MPNGGNINIYTSGWPKNQDKCWYSNRSPPPQASNYHVLKCLSNNNIVTAEANTGTDIIINHAVIYILHIYKLILL